MSGGSWALDRAATSTYLGLASIVTWLGAQSPQIYENFKRGSVEGQLAPSPLEQCRLRGTSQLTFLSCDALMWPGLALPFLVSWFVGDFTNFLG